MHEVVVINGSPRLERGDTGRLVESFVQGMRDAGAHVFVSCASRLKIKPCRCGKMYCWYESPGLCCIEDEMGPILATVRAADTLVLATPVYIPLPGEMQNVINRLCPLIRPLLEWHDGRTRATVQDGVRLRRVALVATGGWWEKENFDTVERIARELAADAGLEFAGAVLRPHSFLMWKDGTPTEEGALVLEAVHRAGRELISKGSISPSSLEAISKPLISEEELRHRYNNAL